jgi:glycosyltransferase involved in cell wall biosynthesis
MKSKKIKKIFVICPFPEGEAAGQRLKYEQFFDHWRKNGYEIEVSPFMDKQMWSIVYTQGNYFQKVFGTIKGYFRRIRDIFRLRNFDLVYVFMWVTPFGSSFFERLFVRLSHKLIYDIEDNALILQSNDLNPVIKLFKGAGKIEFLIKSANHVITSSPFLNEDCLKLNQQKSCTFISDAIDIRRYSPNNKYSNNKTVVIGWTGTFSSAIYLDLLKNVFFELNKRIDFKLRIIGNFEYSIPGIDLEVIQWSKETEIEDLQGIDIGIYPLTQDKWVLGKSGLKAIQYMALGLPTVATNVGTNPSIISHMENGLLVKTDQEWILALQNLIEMPDLRAKIGAKARNTIEENYSTEVMKGKYLSILNKLTR